MKLRKDSSSAKNGRAALLNCVIASIAKQLKTSVVGVKETYPREGSNPIPSPARGRGVGERAVAKKLTLHTPMWFGHRVFRTAAAVAIVAMVNLTVHPLAVAMNAPKPTTLQTLETSADRQLVELIDNVRATLMSPTDSVMRKEFDPKTALEKFDTLTEKIRVSIDTEREAAKGDAAQLDTLKQQFDNRSQTFRSKLQDMIPQGIIFKTAKSNGTDLAQWLDEFCYWKIHFS